MGVATGGPARRLRTFGPPAVRVLGLLAIIPIAERASSQAFAAQLLQNVETSYVTLVGILFVAGTGWLALTGTFGFGSLRRSDGVGMVPFAVALIVREWLTLHSVEEIEIKFAQGPMVKHSAVYALFQMFFHPLVTDTHRFTMHLNGVLGAVACLSLYLFTRQRTGSRTAGFLCALFLAVHPIVARFAPTDAPYSLMLAGWFSGLALLSAQPLAPRALLGGGLLLGIAATTRMEGPLILPASLLLLKPGDLLAGARADPLLASFAALAVASLLAVHLYLGLPSFVDPQHPSSAIGEFLPSIETLFADAVWIAWYAFRPFVWLVWLAAVLGVLPRFRLGLGASIGSLLLAAPVTRSAEWLPALHRLVPACALQSIAAGMGAYVLTAWLRPRGRAGWLLALPGSILAVAMFVETRATLTEPHPFTQEYDLIRKYLAPHGSALTDCTLLTLRRPSLDSLDLHDPAQVAPPVRVLDCSRTDCIDVVARGGCFYYYRTTEAFLHRHALPPGCTASGASAECLNAEARTLEGRLALEPVELRWTTIAAKIHRADHYYPEHAPLGLFRVRAAYPENAAPSPLEPQTLKPSSRPSPRSPA